MQNENSTLELRFRAWRAVDQKKAKLCTDQTHLADVNPSLTIRKGHTDGDRRNINYLQKHAHIGTRAVRGEMASSIPFHYPPRAPRSSSAVSDAVVNSLASNFRTVRLRCRSVQTLSNGLRDWHWIRVQYGVQ